MARVLILITNPYDKGRYFCGEGDSEWTACWWGNKTAIRRLEDVNILFSEVRKGKENDCIYKQSIGPKYEKNPPEYEGLRYLLLSGVEELISEISDSSWSLDSTRRALIVFRKMIQEIADIQNYLNKDGHDVCTCEHRIDSDYCSYTGSQSYWPELMRLRYMSISHEDRRDFSSSVSRVGAFSGSRLEAFDRVWSQLECPDECRDETTLESKAEKATSEYVRDDRRAPANRLSTLKHDFSHLFLPVDTDLRGWIESNFDQEYGEEIAEVYSLDEIEKLLSEARQIIYGDNGVRDIIEDQGIGDEYKYRLVRKLLPPENRVHHSWEVLFEIGRGKIDKARRLLEDNCSFCEWFQNLEKQLYDIQKRVRSSE